MKVVLDTNIVIAALNGNADVRARLDELDARDVGVPSVVLAELAYGAERSRRKTENLARVDGIRRTFPTAAVTEETAFRYGGLRATLEAAGTPRTDFDLLVACAALEKGAILVTHDQPLADAAIHGLAVEDWLGD